MQKYHNIGRKGYKKGPNSDYKPLCSTSHPHDSILDHPKPQLFRGFIGGIAFITKKGYRGERLDSLWVKQILEAFLNDDEELVLIALESSLADVSLVVEGGSNGSPMSIGGFGFLIDKQLSNQVELLQKNERFLANGRQFISQEQWAIADQRLNQLGMYGEARFPRASPGDSFASLAVRGQALKCASVFIQKGIDPLRENSEGHDFFDVLREEYSILGQRLLGLQTHSQQRTTRVMKPSELRELSEREEGLFGSLRDMVSLTLLLDPGLRTRLGDIERDKWAMRKADLRGHPFPDERRWNVAQQDKAVRHIHECQELQTNIEMRIQRHIEEVSGHAKSDLTSSTLHHSQALGLSLHPNHLPSLSPTLNPSFLATPALGRSRSSSLVLLPSLPQKSPS